MNYDVKLNGAKVEQFLSLEPLKHETRHPQNLDMGGAHYVTLLCYIIIITVM